MELAMGETIGGYAAKSVKRTHLIVIMCMIILQRISLLDLTNWTQFQKKRLENTYEIVRDYWGMRLMLHMLSI